MGRVGIRKRVPVCGRGSVSGQNVMGLGFEIYSRHADDSLLSACGNLSTTTPYSLHTACIHSHGGRTNLTALQYHRDQFKVLSESKAAELVLRGDEIRRLHIVVRVHHGRAWWVFLF